MTSNSTPMVAMWKASDQSEWAPDSSTLDSVDAKGC